jgi:exonuclease III
MNLGYFSILCWNVHGLGDPAKCSVVKDVIREVHPSIICIQETKLMDVSLAKFNFFAPHSLSNFTMLPSTGSKGGTIPTPSTLPIFLPI